MARTISVKLGQLAKALEVKKIKSGTTLNEFLEDNGLSFSSSVRVNGEKASKSTELEAGDIIMVVGSVSGGI